MINSLNCTCCFSTVQQTNYKAEYNHEIASKLTHKGLCIGNAAIVCFTEGKRLQKAAKGCPLEGNQCF